MKDIFDIPLTEPKRLAAYIVLQSLNPSDDYSGGVRIRFKEQARREIDIYYQTSDEIKNEKDQWVIRKKLARFISKKQEEFVNLITEIRQELFRLNPAMANDLFPIVIDPSTFTPQNVIRILSPW